MTDATKHALALRASAARFASFMEDERRLLREDGITGGITGEMSVSQVPLAVFDACTPNNPTIFQGSEHHEHVYGHLIGGTLTSTRVVLSSVAWRAQTGGDWRDRSGYRGAIETDDAARRDMEESRG